jgi:hypothetical protein
MTSSPRWLMASTATRPSLGLGNGRDVSLWSVDPGVFVDLGLEGGLESSLLRPDPEFRRKEARPQAAGGRSEGAGLSSALSRPRRRPRVWFSIPKTPLRGASQPVSTPLGPARSGSGGAEMPAPGSPSSRSRSGNIQRWLGPAGCNPTKRAAVSSSRFTALPRRCGKR